MHAAATAAAAVVACHVCGGHDAAHALFLGCRSHHYGLVCVAAPQTLARWCFLVSVMQVSTLYNTPSLLQQQPSAEPLYPSLYPGARQQRGFVTRWAV